MMIIMMIKTKKTMKIAEPIHTRLKSELGFGSFDNLFSALLDFKKEHKREWNEFIKRTRG